MRTTKLTLMLLAVLLLTACAQSSRLKSLVESKNADCPYELEENVTVNSVELVDGNTVVFYMELSSIFDDVFDDEEDDEIYKEVLHETLLEWFADSDSPYDDVVNAVIDEEGHIICEMKTPKGKTWNCEYSAFWLKKAQEANSETFDSDDSEDSDDDDYSLTDEELETALGKGRRELPNNLGNGMVMTAMDATSSDLVFTIECDDDKISISMLNQMKSEMKEAMNELMTSDDENILILCKLAANTNRGLLFKYVGVPSGELCKVRLSNSEIKRALGL
jgi:hypothetical protein